MLRPCIAHMPRSQKLNLLCCLCFVLILHGAERESGQFVDRGAAATFVIPFEVSRFYVLRYPGRLYFNRKVYTEREFRWQRAAVTI